MFLQRPQKNSYPVFLNMELSVLYFLKSLLEYLRYSQNIWDIPNSTYSNSTQRKNNHIYLILKCQERSTACNKGNFCP